MGQIKLSVVIPAYNEEKRLGPNLGPVMDFLEKNFPSHELIIVDDGSSDNTAQTTARAIVHNKKAELISYLPNQGKGYAVRSGVAASRGELVLFMDADLSTPLIEIPKILKFLASSDIVIGSRAKSGSKVAIRPPLYRRAASWLFDQVKYSIVGLREFKDTQCGFKAFKGEVARKLFAKSIINRFMFDVEILYMAQKMGYSIAEMPVEWADMPDSKVRFWEGIVNMFRDLWRIRYTNRA